MLCLRLRFKRLNGLRVSDDRETSYYLWGCERRESAILLAMITVVQVDHSVQIESPELIHVVRNAHF